MIRQGTRKDVRYIYDLVVQELLPYARQARPETKVSRTEIERRLRRMNVWIVSLRPKGKPVGFLTFKKQDKHITIDMLAVGRAYQSKGYGSFLMTALEQYARQHNAKTIYLYVDEGNEQAVRFYIRHGYAVSDYFSSLRCYALKKALLANSGS